MSQSPRSWLRFGLSSLLWLTTCVAVSIGMYRLGYQGAQDDAVNNRSALASTTVHRYFVSKIVPQTTVNGKVVNDFDGLTDDLQQEVLPNTWQRNGGLAWIGADPTSNSLVISHDEDGHERIGKWLRQRREQAKRAIPATTATARPLRQPAASR